MLEELWFARRLMPVESVTAPNTHTAQIIGFETQSRFPAT